MMKVRKSTIDDRDEIEKFNEGGCLNDGIRHLFGKLQIEKTLELSLIALTVVSDNNEIIGFAALDNSPLSEMDLTTEQYVSQLTVYDTTNKFNFVVRDTLWLTCLSTKYSFNDQILKAILEYVFAKCLYVNNIVCSTISSSNDSYNKLQPRFDKLEAPTESNNSLQEYTILATSRSDMDIHLRNMFIRPAKIEDYDDLCPIFEAQHEELTSFFGEFDLSNLLSISSAQKTSLVAEVQGKVVGLIQLSEVGTLTQLQDCFQLQTYNGLQNDLQMANSKAASLPICLYGSDEILRSIIPAIAEQTNFAVVAVQVQSKLSYTATLTSKGQEKCEYEIQDDQLNEFVEDSLCKMQEENETCIVAGYPRTAKQATFVKNSGIKLAKAYYVRHPQSFDGVGSDTATLGSQDLSFSMETLSSWLSNICTVQCIQLPPNYSIKTDILAKIMQQAKEGNNKDLNMGSKENTTSNAFGITMLCMDALYNTRAADFLPEAFKQFSNHQYCVMTVPLQAQEPDILETFDQAVSNITSNFSHSLFILHKHATNLHQNMQVSRYKEKIHCSNIESMINNANYFAMVLDTLHSTNEFEDIDFDSNPMSAGFVVSIDNKIVGVAVASREGTSLRGLDELKSSHDIETEVPFNIHRSSMHAVVTMMYVVPEYRSIARLYLIEILRLYCKTCLHFWDVAGNCKGALKKLAVAAHPRIHLAVNEEPSTNLPSALPTNVPKYMGYFSKKMAWQKKISFNCRVLIAGASDAGLHCAAQLARSANCTLNNIIIVSPHGLDRISMTNHDQMTNVHPLCLSNYGHDTESRSILEEQVHVIRGKVISVDRNGKTAVLDNDQYVSYDYLIIATGLCPDAEYLVKKQSQKLGNKLTLPKNILSIRDFKSAKSFQDNVLQLTKRQGSQKIIVYGFSLRTISIICFMLDQSILPTKILWILPVEKAEYLSKLCEIENEIFERISSSGVIVKFGLLLQGFEEYDDAFEVTGAKFVELSETQNGREIQINFLALVCGEKSTPDADMFEALNECCLVYDGRLVTDPCFKTNDKSIFATGTISRFSRRFKGLHLHEMYNSKELGDRTAEAVISTMRGCQGGFQGASVLPPKLVAPYGVYGILGTFNFVKVFLPGHSLKPEYGYTTRCQVSTIDDTNEQDPLRDDICTLYVDQFGIIIGLMYLGTISVSIQKLAKIVGMHESLFGGATALFQKGRISNWISFLQDPTFACLYSDRFGTCCVHLDGLLNSDPGVREVVSKEKAQLRSEEPANDFFITQDLPESTIKLVQKHLNLFLGENRDTIKGYF